MRWESFVHLVGSDQRWESFVHLVGSDQRWDFFVHLVGSDQRWDFFVHLVGSDQRWGIMLDPAISSRLCLTLLHSVWLVSLLAFFAWIADRLVGRRAVERSYAIHVVALVASMLALPVTYWIVTAQGVTPQREVALTAESVPVAESPPAATSPVPPEFGPAGETPSAMFVPVEPQGTDVASAPVPRNIERAKIWATIAPWLAGLYLAGVVVMLTRLALGIWRAQRLGTGAEILREGPLVDMLRSLTQQWSMRIVPVLARAEQIVTPKVIGLVRPTILLPASAVSGLSTDELELILAHELAHVRRYDMWVNLVQRLAEAVLFFNPALWYLSRRVSLLREYCCDEAVCGTGVDSAEPHLRYAQALLRAVEVAGVARDKTELASLAATGRSPSELRRRVARLFGEPMAESLRISRSGIVLTATLVLLLVAGPVAWQSAAQTSPTDRAEAEKEATSEDKSGNGETAPNDAEPPEQTTAPITVFGRALDQDGKPIAHAEIFLASPRTDGEPLAIVKTGTDGSYRFEEVPLTIKRADTNSGKDNGSFEVFARAEGYGLTWRPLKWFYPDSAHVDGTVPDPTWDLPYKYGREDPIELDLLFGPPKSLRGRVVNDLGQPIAGTKLAIRGAKLWGDSRSLRDLESFNWKALVPESVKVRYTDDQGRFEFPNLPADRVFRIDVEPPGYTERQIYAVTREGVDKDSQGNLVYSGDFEIVFGRPRKVKFHVVYGDTGGPADRVGVGCKTSVAGFWETTDADGFVEVPLPDGQYELSFSPRYMTDYVRTDAEVTVSEETAKMPISIRLQPAAVVDMTVLDADSGKPLEGADVWLEQTPSGSATPYRRVHGYRRWEVETRISHYTSPRSDTNGKMRVLFEPGKHRIGIGKEAYPEGYVPGEPNGKVINCQPGEPTAVVFHMRKLAAAGSNSSASSEPPSPPDQFTLHIVDPDGKPIPGAMVEIRSFPIPTADQVLQGEVVKMGDYGPFAKADENGRIVVALSENPDRLNFSIITPGYGPYWAGWYTGHRKTIPNEFTAQLGPAWSIGGIVVDEEGNPIEGVEIRPGIDYKKRPGDNRQLGMGDWFMTNAQGHWSFDSVPVSMSEVWCEITHPDFMSNRQSLTRAEFGIEQGDEPKGKVVLARGLTVTGNVTDETGEPIEGAVVRTQFFNDVRKSETNAEGVYTLVGCEPRMTRIVVTAKDKAVDMKEVRIEPGMNPVDFQMQPGGTVRIRVLDENDNPIPKARIFFQWWRGGQAYFDFNHVNQYADENGVWEWNEAPHDEFQADICRPGGMQITRQKLIARDEEYVLHPPPALVITGTVVDAETQEPIREFRAVPGRQDSSERIIWDRNESDQTTDGKYRLVRTYGCHAHLVRIEANGYLSTVSRQIKNGEGNVTLDFELTKGKDVAATVLTPAGKPAAKAEVALGIAGSQIRVENGSFTRSTYAARQTADESGHFHFPAQGTDFQVVLTHPTGYAYIKATPDSFPETIDLTAWARVEGTFRIGKQTAGNVPLRIIASDLSSFGDDALSVNFSHEVTTMPDGSFTFERVVPGRGRIGRDLVLMVGDGALEKKTSCMVRAYFPAGETTRLDLGGAGRTVIGKLQPPANFKQKVLWNFALVKVNSDVPQPETPQSLEEGPNGPEARKKRWDEWRKTDEGKAWGAAYQRYQKLCDAKPYVTATVGSDGTFRIDDIPADKYTLKVRFSRESPGHLRNYRFEVPETADSSSTDPLDLGVLTLNAEP